MILLLKNIGESGLESVKLAARTLSLNADAGNIKELVEDIDNRAKNEEQK